MNARIVACRSFNDSDQESFARASGDFNPMHLDAIAARRTQAGAPVVHGIHAVLWAIDALAAARRINGPIAFVDVTFEKFIYVGSDVELHVTRDDQTALRAEFIVEGMKTTILTVGRGPMPQLDQSAPGAIAVSEYSMPLVLDVADLPHRSGRLPGREGMPNAQLFASAAALIGAERVEAIAQLSTLVGMACPGLHSMFSSARIRLVKQADRTAGIAFEVKTVDERFRMVELAVTGSGILAAVTAFVRQPPVIQPSLTDLAAFVGDREFCETTALVVGGSRGLGALTAKAIAAGGGRVIVTYLVGDADAREIQAEIGLDRCRILRFDARDEAAPQLAGLDWTPSQVYYFATPSIFRPKAAGYSPKRFAEFCRVYVNGFEATCTALIALGAQGLAAFYPSSLAVEERPREMTEYSMAKAAGEVLCADMNRFVRGLRVVVHRLPRLLTDQTATVMPAHSEDPVPVMLAAIRELHRSEP